MNPHVQDTVCCVIGSCIVLWFIARHVVTVRSMQGSRYDMCTSHLLLLLGIVCFVWLLGVSAVAALLSSSLSLVCIRENCVSYGPRVANSFT